MHFLASRARTSFDNLKKRYSKKKNDFKKAQRSGTSREAVQKAETELKSLIFMAWLDSFIQLRDTKSNFQEVAKETSQQDLSTPQIDDEEEGVSDDQEDDFIENKSRNEANIQSALENSGQSSSVDSKSVSCNKKRKKTPRK